MNANRQSDDPVVPATSANNDAAEASAESSDRGVKEVPVMVCHAVT